LSTSLANLPDKLSDWNIETIERLLPILSIEGDTFDFNGNILKSKYELYNDLCAMSNSSGGFLVLGIND
jgi:predicted HTH transcriptional regulator